MHNFDAVSEAVWHKNVPLKVSICLSRLLHNMWSTKDNLVCRGIIPSDSQLRVSGCGNNESAYHLLIHCLIFGMLWQHVKTWIGVYLVDPQHVLDHFIQFAYSSRGFKPRRLLLQLIWLYSVWVLWNERNLMFFSNNAKSIIHLLEKKVKITSLPWLKAKNVCFPFGYHMRWQQPFICLGIRWLSFFVLLLDTLFYSSLEVEIPMNYHLTWEDLFPNFTTWYKYLTKL